MLYNIKYYIDGYTDGLFEYLVSCQKMKMDEYSLSDIVYEDKSSRQIQSFWQGRGKDVAKLSFSLKTCRPKIVGEEEKRNTPTITGIVLLGQNASDDDDVFPR